MEDAALVERIRRCSSLGAEDLHVVSRALAPGVADQAAVRALIRIEVVLGEIRDALLAMATAPQPPPPPTTPAVDANLIAEPKPTKRGR